MKQLPTLSVDCRDKTIADERYAGVQVVIDPRTNRLVALVQPNEAGNYDNAGEIVDRCNAYPELVKRLRFYAIIETQKPLQAKVEYDGYRCRCCGSTWKFHRPETHASNCVLFGTATEDPLLKKIADGHAGK